MKFLLAIALLSSVVFANDDGKIEGQKNTKEDKRTAYKIAKKACLKENKDLRGKLLKECIVSKNK